MELEEYDLMHELEDTHWWYQALHAHILRTVRDKYADRPIRILDLGCGTGGLLKKLTVEFPSAQCIGSDFLISCCERSKAKASVLTVNANANNLPFGEGVFDIVIAADLLYHEAVNPEATLQQIHSILKSDSVLIVNVPAYQWLSSDHDKQVQGARRYTKKMLCTLMSESKFDIRMVTYWNTFLFPIMVFSRKVLSLFRKEEQSDVQELPSVIERIFGLILKIETNLIARGLRMPFGGSVFTVVNKKHEKK